MSLNLPHTNGILSFTAGADLTGREGKAVSLLAHLDGSSDGTITWFENTGVDRPFGILLEGAAEGEQVSVAVLGATSGSIPIKLINAVSNVGAYIIANGEEHPHDTGEYWVVGTALETGVEGEIIPIAPCFPVKLT